MIDSLRKQVKSLGAMDTLQRFGVTPQAYGLVTLHRPSNVDVPEILGGILAALSGIAGRIPLLFPVHPRTRARIAEWGMAGYFTEYAAGEMKCGLHETPPLGYRDFLELMRKARLVLTDSGGIQEETTVLSVPCLTLRNNTERPSTIEAGTNRLVGTDPEAIITEASKVLDAPKPKAMLPPLWDGKAAERIADVLIKLA
jgi:UDP-N-acetylglucosamine 2-epimerase (non-hydrolysing)